MKMDGFGMADEFIGNAVGKCMRPWRCPDFSKRRDYEMLQKSRVKSGKFGVALMIMIK